MGRSKFKRKIASVFIRGLVAVVPSIITIYVIWFCIEFLELSLRSLILLFIDDWEYIPGSGLMFFIALVVAFGLSIHFSPMRYVFLAAERRIMDIPVAKSIYGAVKDMMGLFGDSPDLTRPVLLSLPGQSGYLVGFLTSPEPEQFLGESGAGKVAVYCPMSYQIGGFTVLVEPDTLLDVSADKEAVLRFILTAGVSHKII